MGHPPGGGSPDGRAPSLLLRRELLHRPHRPWAVVVCKTSFPSLPGSSCLPAAPPLPCLAAGRLPWGSYELQKFGNSSGCSNTWNSFAPAPKVW